MSQVGLISLFIGNLTAEPPRTQRSVFLFGGESLPNKKHSVISKHEFYPVAGLLRHSWFYPARDEVYDPIVVSRLDHNKSPSVPSAALR